MDARDIPVDKLPDVVLGRERAFPRAEAMALLAASGDPRREALLAQVLEDRGEQRRYRVTAAIALGRIFNAGAERALMRNVSIDHPALGDVLKSLGRIGGREALAAIEGLPLSGRDPARGAAQFAAALISYRLGLAGHDLPLPPENEWLPLAGTEARRIEIGKMDPAASEVVLEGLKRHPFGVEFDPAAITRVYCAGEVNAICVTHEFAGKDGPVRAGQRKGVLAVVALQSPETGDYSPSYLVLTRPAEQEAGVEVVVTRGSGAYALAGRGRVTGMRGEFELRSVRRPGARAIHIRGALVDGIVQTAEAFASIEPEPAKRPLRVVVDRRERTDEERRGR